MFLMNVTFFIWLLSGVSVIFQEVIISIVFVLHISWVKSVLFIEVSSKDTLHYFTLLYRLFLFVCQRGLLNIEVSACPIGKDKK